MAVSSKINRFHSQAGDVDVPCIVVQGYDSGGDETDTEGSVVTADILVIGETITRFGGATKGTDPGEFSYSS